MSIQTLLRFGGYMAPAGEESASGTDDDLDTQNRGDELADETVTTTETDGVETGKNKDIMIPKGRFDDAVKKERERAEKADRRAQELEEELNASRAVVDTKKLESDIDDLEEQLDKALADNDPAEKKRLRAEIRAKTTELADAKAEARSRYSIAVAVEQVRYDNAVAALEAAHPELNPDSDDYDEDVTDSIKELKTAYEATGIASSVALTKAAKLVFASLPKKEADKPKEEDKETPEAAAKRKEEAIKTAMAAKGKQPPNSRDVGRSSDKAGRGKLDLSKMSDADFDKLTPAELAEMRGDARV